MSGIGFALACDLLKELGYEDYPKPDVHLMDVFSELNLCRKTQIYTYEAIVKMAEVCKEELNDSSITPYKVDKIFWLICSGRFYLEKGGEIKVPLRKKAFIVSGKEVLAEVK